MIRNLGPGKKPLVNLALHMGWTIEGAIGSETKIDATYMSPHLQTTYKLEKLSDKYD